MSDHLWQEQAKEMGGQGLVEMVSSMRETQLTILAKLNHAEDFYAEQANKIDAVLLAFPKGDVDGHRRYHEAVIEWQELRNKLVREALVKAAQAVGLAAIGWLGIALWRAFKLTLAGSL